MDAQRTWQSADMHEYLARSSGRYTLVDPGPRALRDAPRLGPPLGTGY